MSTGGRRNLELFLGVNTQPFRHGPPRMSLQIRYLGELERSAWNIMLSGVLDYRTFYELCSQAMRSNGMVLSCFIHLYVKLQMSTYVKQKAVRLHRTRQNELLWSLFQTAATE
jgi:hypothetical protein